MPAASLKKPLALMDVTTAAVLADAGTSSVDRAVGPVPLSSLPSFLNVDPSDLSSLPPASSVSSASEEESESWTAEAMVNGPGSSELSLFSELSLSSAAALVEPRLHTFPDPFAELSDPIRFTLPSVTAALATVGAQNSQQDLGGRSRPGLEADCNSSVDLPHQSQDYDKTEQSACESADDETELQSDVSTGSHTEDEPVIAIFPAALWES